MPESAPDGSISLHLAEASKLLASFCIPRRKLPRFSRCVVGCGVKWNLWEFSDWEGGVHVPWHVLAQARREGAAHPSGQVPRRARGGRRADAWAGPLRLRLLE
ncbi:hypothetical protein ACFPRL_02830 [Pseudoclavibacter helvolus]